MRSLEAFPGKIEKFILSQDQITDVAMNDVVVNYVPGKEKLFANDGYE
jgi:hypothetical protein